MKNPMSDRAVPCVAADISDQMQAREQAPFTSKQVADLIVGQKFKTEGLFQGVSDEKVKWKVLTVTRGLKVTVFRMEATYFGVSLGQYTVNLSNKGKVTFDGL